MIVRVHRVKMVESVLNLLKDTSAVAHQDTMEHTVKLVREKLVKLVL